MKRSICFILFGMFVTVTSFSQEIRSYVITSAGAAIMSDGGGLYLSIGEPMNTEIHGGEIMISQGFLQVSISETTSNENLLDEPIQVFPNPSVSILNIEIPEFDGSYRYELFDALGKMHDKGQLDAASNQLNLQSQSPGTYYLRVTKAAKVSKTVKIVKL